MWNKQPAPSSGDNVRGNMSMFKFDNQGTNTYLIYEVKDNDEVDTLSLGMLTNNSIPGIAAVSYSQIDTARYIRYNVSSKISVSQLFSGPVNKRRLIGAVSGIVQAMLAAEEYMLDERELVLNLDYIFTDVSTCETVVICLPVVRQDAEIPELGRFFKAIFFNVEYDRTENCDYVAKILNYLNSAETFSLVQFKSVLEEIVKESAGQENAAQQTVQNNVVQRAVAPAQNLNQVNAVCVQQTIAPSVPPVQNQGGAEKGKNIVAVPTPKNEQSEKGMSWFYLMQHYNKENAAKYKAQQEEAKAKKAGKSKSKTANKAINPPPANPVPNKPAQNQGRVGYAVPGQSATAVAERTATAAPTQHQAVVPNVPAQRAAEPPVISSPQVRSPEPIHFGETTVLFSGVGETTVLGVTPVAESRPYLIRIKNNEKIDLNKPIFRIGKEKSYVDYFIGDNSAISRSHANVISRDGEYFVVDTNSTNHTYVNGQMLQSNVETKVAHGAKIRLGNEDFEFKLY